MIQSQVCHWFSRAARDDTEAGQQKVSHEHDASIFSEYNRSYNERTIIIIKEKAYVQFDLYSRLETSAQRTSLYRTNRSEIVSLESIF